MRIVFTERARKDWCKLDRAVQKQLRKKLFYCLQEGPLFGPAEKLKNYRMGEYRFRVGDYRIIFDRADDAIIVLRIGHRKDIYR